MNRWKFATALLFTVSAADDIHGQTAVKGEPDVFASSGTRTVIAGGSYGMSPAWRWLLGDNWRDIWDREITVPVLDLQQTAGGLTPFKQGGNQSRTLHFRGGNGLRYVFRSVEKNVHNAVGGDVAHSTIGDLIQDQTSANQPSASTIADVLQRAAGVLHPRPVLVVLPDDERLGEYRATFRNMLGHFEIKPDDVEDGDAFAGADKIQGSDKLLENLDESLEYRLDARAYLKARLMDAIMGDFDRGADQWDWARFDENGLKTYRPIARDRDWAFMHADGLLMKLARQYYKKVGSYDPSNENLGSVTFMTHEFDRSHLVIVPWHEWEAVVNEIRGSLTDAVIDAAAHAQPSPYHAGSEEKIAHSLKSRRDGLPELARGFFRLVNEDADVFAADGNEVAQIDRMDDGSVRVRLMRVKKDGTLATDEGYAVDRTFTPDVTHEVRVYMQEGNDRVVVRGHGPALMKLRITGGAGDDVLMDSTTSSAAGERIHFYDASGANTIISTEKTEVHTRPFETRQPSALEPDTTSPPRPRVVLEERRGRFQDQWESEGNFLTKKFQRASGDFWGSKQSVVPAFDLRTGAGVVVGASLTRTDFGFRSVPFASQLRARLTYAPEVSRFRADFGALWYPANKDYALDVNMFASGFEAQRFHGFGNDAIRLSHDSSLITRDEIRFQSLLRWPLSRRTTAAIGPVFSYVDPRPTTTLAESATERLAAAGAAFELGLDRSDDPHAPRQGYRAKLGVNAFQPVQNGDGGYGSVNGTLSFYLPLWRPTLALRAGGEHAFGSFPLHEAAQLGGRHSIRGFAYNRYSGDAALFGNAELRVPITRAEILTYGDLGAILLADAGRVWMDGESPGGWHKSVGAGVSFMTMGHALALVYARGEEGRVYLNFGFPY